MPDEIKTCSQCKEVKPVAEFADNKNGEYRYKRSNCKSCTNIYGRDYRIKNKTILAEKDRARDQTPERKAYHVKRRRKWQLLNKEKRECHWRLLCAVKMGRIKKDPCEICGEIKVDGHHDDYSKPLEVRWLCRLHHNQLHKEQNNDRRIEASI